MQRFRWLRPSVRTTTMALLAALMFSLPLPAQTLFTWPSTMPDVTRLTNVEDCLAAVRRVSDSTRGRSSVWTDTLPFSAAEFLRKLPARVIETAARCSARFPANTVPISNFVPMLRLFLLADRDTDAETLIARRLTAIPATGGRTESSPQLLVDTIRLAILDTTIKTLMQATPARVERAIPYVEQLLTTPGTTLTSRFPLAFGIGLMAQWQGDTVLSRHWFERTLEIAATATETDKQQPLYRLGQEIGFGILMHLHFPELTDSLRVGTDAYVRHLERLWEIVDTDGNAKLPAPVGVHAPPLQADYWFERQGTTQKGVPAPDTAVQVRPVPGRVNLVVFLPTGWGKAGDGWLQGYILKRLKQRFPELEITVISQTRGFVGPLEPPTPDQEADIYRKRLLDHLQWPVTLGVVKTPWWRLDEPDRRRINQSIGSRTAYTFGVGETVESWTAFLIDPDGRLVVNDRLGRMDRLVPGDAEERLGILIQALLLRTSGQ